MKDKKRIQMSLNSELHATLMLIPQTSRGQFINMALNKFMQTEEGKHLLREFATYLPNTAKVEHELKAEIKASGLDSVMGDF